MMSLSIKNLHPSVFSLIFLLLLCILALIPIVLTAIEEKQYEKRMYKRQQIRTVSALMHALKKDAASAPYMPNSAYYESRKAAYLPPIFATIAACESGGKQFHANGHVVHGVKNRNDIGKYQINLTIWGHIARAMGYNIFTEEGNEAMAREIYRRYGLQPWYLSRACWEKRS